MTTECQRTAPERIYLTVFSETDAPFPDDHEGITWCDSEVGDIDPSYVRSDIAAAEIARLQAQVDALEEAGKAALAWMEYAWRRMDGEWGPCGRTLDEECEEGREPEISGLRKALSAAGR